MHGVDALVLTSTVTELARREPEEAFDVPLASITIPTLIVHNRNDGCGAAPFSGMDRLAKVIPGAQTLAFTSEEGSSANPCGPMAPHGYLGIEQQVVDAIANWIDALAASRK